MTSRSPIYQNTRVFVEHQGLPIDKRRKAVFVLEFSLLLKRKKYDHTTCKLGYPYQRMSYLIRALETMSLPFGIKESHEP